MKQCKTIQFAGKEVTTEELMQILFIMPQEHQKRIYDYGCELIEKYQIELNDGNKTHKINTALLAYVRRENRQIRLYFLDRRDSEYIDKLSLTEFEALLNAKQNEVNPFLRLKSVILFKGLFLRFKFRNVITISDLKHFLISVWQLKPGRKSIEQIKEWLTAVL